MESQLPVPEASRDVQVATTGTKSDAPVVSALSLMSSGFGNTLSPLNVSNGGSFKTPAKLTPAQPSLAALRSALSPRTAEPSLAPPEPVVNNDASATTTPLSSPSNAAAMSSPTSPSGKTKKEKEKQRQQKAAELVAKRLAEKRAAAGEVHADCDQASPQADEDVEE